MSDIERYLMDQRLEVRYQTNLAAKVLSAEGLPLTGVISNISRSGLQLTASQKVLQVLMPKQVTHRPIEAVPFRVSFLVPTTHQDAAAISLSCQVVYTRRKSMDVFFMGCQFLTFDDGCEESLQDYLQHFAHVDRH